MDARSPRPPLARNRASDACSRQQRHRQRQRDGKVVLKIVVDEIALVDELQRRGLLQPHEADDRRRILEIVEQHGVIGFD